VVTQRTEFLSRASRAAPSSCSLELFPSLEINLLFTCFRKLQFIRLPHSRPREPHCSPFATARGTVEVARRPSERPISSPWALITHCVRHPDRLGTPASEKRPLRPWLSPHSRVAHPTY
jgi:hypothetical protein